MIWKISLLQSSLYLKHDNFLELYCRKTTSKSFCPILKVTDMLNTWQKAYDAMCSKTYHFELKLNGLSIE